MKIKTSNLLVAIILFAATAFGQSSVWKISGNGKTVFLGGTVHILKEKDFPLPDEFDLAYGQADLLVFEADVKQVQSQEGMAKLMQAAIYGGDTTLQTVLSQPVYDSLSKAFSEAGMSIKMFDKMRISMTIMSLVAIKLRNMGMTNEGVDMYYYTKAIESEKEIQFLETVEKQIHILLHMGEGFEDAFVKYSLRDLHQIETMLTELVNSWRSGNTKFEEAIIEEMATDFPVLYNNLLAERNNDWMKTIDGYFETDAVEFVLVGNLHMYGNEGLLNQLKDKGYKIEQISAGK
ncbi:MAG: TraB/GumN family protein [Bacteroidales bacterium]|nr:TraB/GumN family protein [Bacteroidales bacterium]